MEDLDLRGCAGRLDKRATRSLRWPMDIQAEVFVDGIEDETSTDPNDRLLDARQTTLFRGLVARVNFLAQDRGDLQFASKECSRKMSSPRVRDMEGIKRIGRYLIGCPRVVTRFVWQDEPNHLTVYTDSNWAGCKETRKSTSGGCFMHGKHLLKTYSRTQNTIALSSAEAELYATVQGASEGLGFAAMALDFGKTMVPWLYVDASAAIGIAQRKGLGKIRHLDTQSLWVQDAVRTKRVMLEKVLGTENPADMYTKHLDAGNLNKCMLKTGMVVKGGRSSLAPDLVRSEGKNDKLEVDATVDSVIGDDEIGIVEEQLQECQWQKDEGRSRAQRGTPQPRGGSEIEAVRAPSGQPLEQQDVELHQFVRAPSGQPSAQQEVEQHRLTEARIENEEVRSLANRRNESRSLPRRLGPVGQKPSRSDGECANISKILRESGTCSCQPRRGARHRYSALIARGEVQNETPSLYNKQAAAFSFSHSCECVHRQCHQCTQQHDHTPSGNRCTCEQLTMHMRVRTYRCAHAPVTQRTWHLEANCLSSSAHTSYLTATSDSCCCWGSSA